MALTRNAVFPVLLAALGCPLQAFAADATPPAAAPSGEAAAAVATAVVVAPPATPATVAEQALQEPSSFDLAPKPTAKDKVAVYFYRTGPYMFPVKLKINDETVLKFPHGFSWFELEPGIYKFTLNGGLLLPALKLNFEQKIEAGKGPYYIRTYVSGYEARVSEASAEEALAAMKDMSYLAPLMTDIKPKISLK